MDTGSSARSVLGPGSIAHPLGPGPGQAQSPRNSSLTRVQRRPISGPLVSQDSSKPSLAFQTRSCVLRHPVTEKLMVASPNPSTTRLFSFLFPAYRCEWRRTSKYRLRSSFPPSSPMDLSLRLALGRASCTGVRIRLPAGRAWTSPVSCTGARVHVRAEPGLDSERG